MLILSWWDHKWLVFTYKFILHIFIYIYTKRVCHSRHNGYVSAGGQSDTGMNGTIYINGFVLILCR